MEVDPFHGQLLPCDVAVLVAVVKVNFAMT